MTEQLKLHFRGRPKVDPGFKRFNVHLYRDRFAKTATFVSGIWAKSPEQAIVLAAKKRRVKKYSIEDSLAIPRKP